MIVAPVLKSSRVRRINKENAVRHYRNRGMIEEIIHNDHAHNNRQVMLVTVALNAVAIIVTMMVMIPSRICENKDQN